MRDDIKKKSELIKELQTLRKKIVSQESSLKKFKSIDKKIKSLRDIQKRYKLISENSDDVIWLFDVKKEKFIYVSPSIVKLRGYTPEEVLKQTVKDVLTEEFYNSVQNRLSARIAAFENGDDSVRVALDEIEQLHKDGSVVNTEIVTTLLKNNKGRVYQILGVTRNLAERKRAKLAIAENEKRYKTLFNISATGITIMNTKGIMLDINEAACRINGYTREELIGKNIRLLVPPVHHSEIDKNIERIINGEYIEQETINIRKDGTLCILDLRESLIQLPDGSRGILSITNDITDRIKAEEKIAENENKFRAIFENSFDAIGVSRAGMHLFMNPAYLKLFGYSDNEELIGKSILELIAPSHRADILDRTKRRDKGENLPNAYVTRGLRKDGTEFDMDVHASSHQLEGAPYTIVVLRDITERKRAEEALKKSEDRFRRLFEEDLAANFVSTTEGKLLMCNSAYINMFGFTSVDEALSTSGFSNYRKPSDRNEFIELIKSKGRVVNYEETLRRRDGKLIDIIENVTGHFDENGELYEISGYMYDQTERKRAVEQIKLSEEKYRKIFNFAPVGIFQSNIEGRFLSVNERMVQILGYDSKEELMQCDIATDIYFNKDDRKKVIENYDSPEPAEEQELLWKKKNGEPLWIQLTAKTIKDNSGKTLYYEGFIRDVSKQRVAETQLRENQKLLSLVVETMPIGIWLIDKEGKVIHGNSAAQNIWGGAKFIGIEKYSEYKTWDLSNNPITLENSSIIRALQKGEPTINEELRIERFDKGERFILNSAVPIHNSNKDVVGVVVINQDVTDQRSKETQIRKLSSAVEQSTVSVFITDLQGRIEYVNKKFIESTGYSHEEIIGKNPSILKAGITPAEVYKNLWETISAGNEWRGELLNKTKDGSLFWEFEIISPIRNSSGVITNYLAVKEDITNQKKMTEELIAAKEHAERSDNIKTEFLAQMSHEVRTPLNVLLSYSTYIKEELEERKHLTQDLEQYFETAADAGKRIIRTIELILNMAEIKSGSYLYTPAITDIYNDIITQVYHQFSRGMQKKKLNFEIIQKCEPAIATVDQFSVEQIITQLVNNAMIFTNDGHVKIITEKNSENNLIVKVEDTGIGIGPEYLKILYTPFTQEDQGYSRSYEGNGLGLALTKKYCELNNIQIDVQSEKEKGTVFTLTFP